MDIMPQESFSYNSSYYHTSHDVWDESACLYDDDDYLPMLTAAVVVQQPVTIGLGIGLEGERENLDMEILGPANNGSYTVASTFITSASNKHSYIFDEKEEAYNAWISKPVKRWTRADIMSWIVAVATDNGIPYEQVVLSGFRDYNDGLALSTLTEEDFLKLEPNHGSLFYKALQDVMHRWGCNIYDNDPYRGHGVENTLPGFDSIRRDVESQDPGPMSNWNVMQLNTKQEEKVKGEIHSSDGDSEGEAPEPKTTVKKPVGRPPNDKGRSRRRKQEKKCGRLWEFIRDLLKDNKHCPNDICWVDHDEGTFRFVKSEKVAKLWGDIKENPKMNYEKLSRAMRYYYKSQVLLPVLGRRLVYKFGPNATNWRSNNPNFRY